MRQPLSLALLPFLFHLLCLPAQAQHTFTLTVPDIGKTASERPVVETPDGGFVLLFCKTFQEKAEAQEMTVRNSPSHRINSLSEYAENRAKPHDPQIDSSFFGLAKFSADGLPEWSQYFANGSKNAQPTSLVQTVDGGFIAVGTIAGNRSEKDIAFFRFNAHGQLLSARSYAVDSLSTVNDALPLQDGSLVITGYLNATDEGDWFNGPQIFLLRMDANGDVLIANRYPTLKHFYTRDSKFRRLNDGSVVLIGSTLEVDLFKHVGLLCDVGPDGMIGKGMIVDPVNVQDVVGTIIKDIRPSGTGTYTLLGECLMKSEPRGRFSLPFTQACNTDWGEFQDRFSVGNAATTYRSLLPGGGNAVLAAGEKRGGNTILIQETDESGQFRSVKEIQLPPYSLQEGTHSGQVQQDVVGLQDSTPPAYLPLADQGLLITGLYRASRQPDNSLFISRLSPDLTPCNGTAQYITIEENQDSASQGNNAAATVQRGPAQQSQRVMRELNVLPVEIEVRSRTLSQKTVDFPLEPQMSCQGNDQATIAWTDKGNKTTDILLSPNSVRPGGHCQATFKLQGSGRPDVTILGIATGHTVREIAASAVLWSGADGNGSAAIETSGLPAGVYLVRVRAGERQLTAKLEVR